MRTFPSDIAAQKGAMMPVLAFGVIWGGYTVFLLGWATIKGYVRADNQRIGLGDLVAVKGGGYTGPWGATKKGIIGSVEAGIAPGAAAPAPDPKKAN